MWGWPEMFEQSPNFFLFKLKKLTQFGHFYFPFGNLGGNSKVTT
jgi:hypothetical protein